MSSSGNIIFCPELWGRIFEYSLPISMTEVSRPLREIALNIFADRYRHGVEERHRLVCLIANTSAAGLDDRELMRRITAKFRFVFNRFPAPELSCIRQNIFFLEEVAYEFAQLHSSVTREDQTIGLDRQFQSSMDRIKQNPDLCINPLDEHEVHYMLIVSGMMYGLFEARPDFLRTAVALYARTPMIWMVKNLLSMNARLNPRDRGMALIQAVLGHPDMVELLLNDGAVRRKELSSAIDVSLQVGNREAAAVLQKRLDQMNLHLAVKIGISLALGILCCWSLVRLYRQN